MEEVIFECGALKLERKEGGHSPGTEDMGRGLEAWWGTYVPCMLHVWCDWRVV